MEVARRSVGLPYTPLEEFDEVVKGFFDEGAAAASLKFAALKSAVLRGDTRVDLACRLRLMDSFIIENNSMELMQACHYSCSSAFLSTWVRSYVRCPQMAVTVFGWASYHGGNI